jgi:hypothetical protein
MSEIKRLFALVLLCFLFVAKTTTASAADKPNIIIVLIDDK